jgi:hypothetical protein
VFSAYFFQPRPIFVSKGGAYPSGAHAASNITVKLRALLAKIGPIKKNLQLANTLAFCSSVGDEEKRFIILLLIMIERAMSLLIKFN